MFFSLPAYIPFFRVSFHDKVKHDVLTERARTSMDGRLARVAEFIQFTSQIFWTIILILASYIFDCPLAGHRLKIGRISLARLALHDVHYTGALYHHVYTYSFTLPFISICFHLPLPSNPRWLSFTARDLFYTSTTSDISVVALDVTCWLFPYLFKRTAGPWISVVLDGFCIRVHLSSATPYWVQRLRQNLVGALLKGEILRLDNFSATVQFAGLSETLDQPVKKARKNTTENPLPASCPAPDEYGYDGCDSDDMSVSGEELFSVYEDRIEDEAARESEDESGGRASLRAPPPFLNRDTDALRVSAFARQLHLDNTEGRMYTFARIDAQLRRDWDADRGSFVMVAEEGRWVRMHWPYQRVPTPWWTQLITSIGQFPLDFVQVLNLPMRAIDVYVPRADITFDEFRIRDAELVVQTFSVLREKMGHFGVDWGDILLDTITQAFVQS